MPNSKKTQILLPLVSLMPSCNIALNIPRSQDRCIIPQNNHVDNNVQSRGDRSQRYCITISIFEPSVSAQVPNTYDP